MLPPLKFLATPLPALVVGEENLVIGFGPAHFRNVSAIAESTAPEADALTIRPSELLEIKPKPTAPEADALITSQTAAYFNTAATFL